MPEQLENKLFGNFFNQVKKQLRLPVFEVNEEAKTYRIKSTGLPWLGENITRSYSEQLELRGYRRI